MSGQKWEEQLNSMKECPRCKKATGYKAPRILSVYEDEVICLKCKKKEEQRLDYEEVSKRMIGQCLGDVELQQSDPQGYCFFHFFPYRRR
jgi:hypothetical protein